MTGREVPSEAQLRSALNKRLLTLFDDYPSINPPAKRYNPSFPLSDAGSLSFAENGAGSETATKQGFSEANAPTANNSLGLDIM